MKAINLVVEHLRKLFSSSSFSATLFRLQSSCRHHAGAKAAMQSGRQILPHLARYKASYSESLVALGTGMLNDHKSQ